MALHHAQPLHIIDIRPLGHALGGATTCSLLKSPSLQLMRVVLPAGQGLPQHAVPGAITVQCIEGQAAVITPGRRCELSAGQLVMLRGGEPHAVQAVSDTSLLVTLLLHATGPDPLGSAS
jgi:quercetin dioxygenase-like cupin family protein